MMVRQFDNLKSNEAEEECHSPELVRENVASGLYSNGPPLEPRSTGSSVTSTNESQGLQLP